jgi:phage terminase large subunit-like protein
MAAILSPAGWRPTSPWPRNPAGNLKPARDKSTERIDGIVAAIMAIGRAMVAQDEPQPDYSMFFV